MKRREQSVLLAAVLVMALAGCKSTGDTDKLTGSEATMNGAATTQSGTSAATGTASSYGASGAPSTASGVTDGTTANSAMPVSAPNSTVTSIEVVQKQADAATGGSTAVGGSTTGATGTAMGDRLYRITLRMDDGQAQVITQEWAPSFSTGDRVRMVSGAIQR